MMLDQFRDESFEGLEDRLLQYDYQDTETIKSRLQKATYDEDIKRKLYDSCLGDLQEAWSKLIALRNYMESLQKSIGETSVEESKSYAFANVEQPWKIPINASSTVYENNYSNEIHQINSKLPQLEVLKDIMKISENKLSDIRKQLETNSQALKQSSKQHAISIPLSLSHTMELRQLVLQGSQDLENEMSEYVKVSHELEELERSINNSLHAIESKSIRDQISPDVPSGSASTFSYNVLRTHSEQHLNVNTIIANEKSNNFFNAYDSHISTCDYSLDEILNGKAQIRRMNGEQAISYRKRLEKRHSDLKQLENQLHQEVEARADSLRLAKVGLRDAEVVRLRLSLVVANTEKFNHQVHNLKNTTNFDQSTESPPNRYSWQMASSPPFHFTATPTATSENQFYSNLQAPKYPSFSPSKSIDQSNKIYNDLHTQIGNHPLTSFTPTEIISPFRSYNSIFPSAVEQLPYNNMTSITPFSFTTTPMIFEKDSIAPNVITNANDMVGYAPTVADILGFNMQSDANESTPFGDQDERKRVPNVEREVIDSLDKNTMTDMNIGSSSSSGTGIFDERGSSTERDGQHNFPSGDLERDDDDDDDDVKDELLTKEVSEESDSMISFPNMSYSYSEKSYDDLIEQGDMSPALLPPPVLYSASQSLRRSPSRLTRNQSRKQEAPQISNYIPPHRWENSLRKSSKSSSAPTSRISNTNPKAKGFLNARVQAELEIHTSRRSSSSGRGRGRSSDQDLSSNYTGGEENSHSRRASTSSPLTPRRYSRNVPVENLSSPLSTPDRQHQQKQQLERRHEQQPLSNNIKVVNGLKKNKSSKTKTFQPDNDDDDVLDVSYSEQMITTQREMLSGQESILNILRKHHNEIEEMRQMMFTRYSPSSAPTKKQSPLSATKEAKIPKNSNKNLTQSKSHSPVSRNNRNGQSGKTFIHSNPENRVVTTAAVATEVVSKQNTINISNNSDQKKPSLPSKSLDSNLYQSPSNLSLTALKNKLRDRDTDNKEELDRSFGSLHAFEGLSLSLSKYIDVDLESYRARNRGPPVSTLPQPFHRIERRFEERQGSSSRSPSAAAGRSHSKEYSKDTEEPDRISTPVRVLEGYSNQSRDTWTNARGITGATVRRVQSNLRRSVSASAVLGSARPMVKASPPPLPSSSQLSSIKQSVLLVRNPYYKDEVEEVTRGGGKGNPNRLLPHHVSSKRNLSMNEPYPDLGGSEISAIRGQEDKSYIIDNISSSEDALRSELVLLDQQQHQQRQKKKGVMRSGMVGKDIELSSAASIATSTTSIYQRRQEKIQARGASTTSIRRPLNASSTASDSVPRVLFQSQPANGRRGRGGGDSDHVVMQPGPGMEKAKNRKQTKNTVSRGYGKDISSNSSEVDRSSVKSLQDDSGLSSPFIRKSNHTSLMKGRLTKSKGLISLSPQSLRHRISPRSSPGDKSSCSNDKDETLVSTSLAMRLEEDIVELPRPKKDDWEKYDAREWERMAFQVEGKLKEKLERLTIKLKDMERSEVIDPDTGIAIDKSGESCGTLELTLLCARNLPEMKRSSKSADAFAELWIEDDVGNQKSEIRHRTSTVWGSRYPKWRQYFQFRHLNSLKDILLIELRDATKMGREQDIGLTSLPLQRLLDQLPHTYWLRVHEPGVLIPEARCRPKMDPTCAVKIRIKLSYSKSLALSDRLQESKEELELFHRKREEISAATISKKPNNNNNKSNSNSTNKNSNMNDDSNISNNSILRNTTMASRELTATNFINENKSRFTEQSGGSHQGHLDAAAALVIAEATSAPEPVYQSTLPTSSLPSSSNQSPIANLRRVARANISDHRSSSGSESESGFAMNDHLASSNNLLANKTIDIISMAENKSTLQVDTLKSITALTASSTSPGPGVAISPLGIGFSPKRNLADNTIKTLDPSPQSRSFSQPKYLLSSPGKGVRDSNSDTIDDLPGQLSALPIENNNVLTRTAEDVDAEANAESNLIHLTDVVNRSLSMRNSSSGGGGGGILRTGSTSASSRDHIDDISELTELEDNFQELDSIDISEPGVPVQRISIIKRSAVPSKGSTLTSFQSTGLTFQGARGGGAGGSNANGPKLLRPRTLIPTISSVNDDSEDL